MNVNGKQHRAILQRIAERAMIEKGLLPDFMEVMFDEDLRESDQIHLEEWKKRPLMNHVKEWFTRLLAHWL